MEISVLIDSAYEHVLDEKWLQKIALEALKFECQQPSEMSILITGQEHIRFLHNKYMDDDSPTDVLSFAMCDQAEDAPPFVLPDDNMNHLGEVIISYPQAETQAVEHRHSVKKEVAILLIHGILHLLSYDHDVAKKQQEMQYHEESILKQVEGILI